MWSFLRLFAIGLCIEYLFVQNASGQQSEYPFLNDLSGMMDEHWTFYKRPVFVIDSSFFFENGTELGEIPFGVPLQKIRDDTEVGKELLSLQATGVKSIKTITSNAKSKELYIEPTYDLESKKLTFILTKYFADYEENEFDDILSTWVTFECNIGETKVEFIQPIEDTNNHQPEFQGIPYIYKLPMPFPKGISLNYLAPISARDLDLTNANITFHLDPSDPNVSGFSVSWLSSNRKLHNATLITKTVINFLEDVTFNLYATDTGNPPSTPTMTTVTIEVDRENSIFRFEKSLYTADLTNLKPENANGIIIPFVEGDVALGGGVDDTVTYEILDDLTGYRKNFQPDISNDDDGRSIVRIRLVDPPEKFFLESYVLLKLTAKRLAVKESTVLHISLPGSKTVTATGTTIPEDDNNVSYVVAIVVLAILLVAAIAGLTVIVIRNHRKSSISDLGKNSDQKNVPEMEEVITNGGISPSGSVRKSVAFNDNVLEIKIAKL